MDLADLADTLGAARWRFAGTMPQWPHVYTVRDWWAEDGDFVEACELIEERGRVIPWPRPPAVPRYHHAYLVAAPLKFWAMGPRGDQDQPSCRTVINCAMAEAPDLDYDGLDSARQIGAWSDLSARLSALVQPAQSTRAADRQAAP